MKLARYEARRPDNEFRQAADCRNLNDPFWASTVISCGAAGFEVIFPAGTTKYGTLSPTAGW